MKKKYYYIDAEATVDLIPGSSYDPVQRTANSGPLEIVFIGWLGDHLVTTSPFWFVSEQVADSLRAIKLTGFELEPVKVSIDEQFMLSGSQIPPLTWFRVIPTGSVDTDDDMALEDETELIVSEAVLGVFREHKLEEASVEEY